MNLETYKKFDELKINQMLNIQRSFSSLSCSLLLALKK